MLYHKRSNPSQKGAGEVTQGIGPEFKPQFRQKKGEELFKVDFSFMSDFWPHN
jgi:hypothetical protein